MSAACFHVLGLQSQKEPSANDVLRAWRRLARENHPDKAGDDTAMQALNEAKDECLQEIVMRDYTVSEHEYATHICRVLDRKLAREGGPEFDLEHGGQRIVQVSLREFYWQRGVDAMAWVLHCAFGDTAFDQEIDDEIPILCKFYNEFIGQDQWTEDDHTMMTVLNRHDFIKARGYGNFARFVETAAADRPHTQQC
jgi:hypothetical protein